MGKHIIDCDCCGISFVIDDTQYSQFKHFLEGINCKICLKLNHMERKEIKYTRQFFENINKKTIIKGDLKLKNQVK